MYLQESEKSFFYEFDEEVQKLLTCKRRRSISYNIPSSLSKASIQALQDLEKNHDNSWALEVYLKNRNSLEKTALFYRGNKISYKQLFVNVFCYAKSLISMGIHKGDEVPMLVSNSPEFIYIFMAIDIIGAVMNIVGTWFAPEYLLEIVDSTHSKYLFVSDDSYGCIKEAAEQSSNIEQIIMFSLTDSLPKDSMGKSINPYKEIDDQFSHFQSKIEDFKKNSPLQILDQMEFIQLGMNTKQSIVEDMTLDDACAITYTSGTTKPGYPKGCIHSNRNYLSLARFKMSDVSALPSMENITVLAHLPSYTQTLITTAYTDALYMGWTAALEPYYDIDFFPYSLEINRPNETIETPEFEKYLAKKLETEWQSVMMPYRIAVCIVGQELSVGLERYLNKVARKHKFGVERLHFPLAPVTVSIAGGTTENGGFFTTLFRSLYGKQPKYLLHAAHAELLPLGLAEVSVIHADGRKCQDYERGICVVNSPTNQIRYVKDEFNKDTVITDEKGKEWRTTGTPAYRDRFGGFRMLDRPDTDVITSDGRHTPLYVFNDLIRKNKDVMETYLVQIDTNDGRKYVCHIEKQPNSKISDKELTEKIQKQLELKINKEILENLYFRFHSFEEGFPVAGTGKTDLRALVSEGRSRVIS